MEYVLKHQGGFQTLADEATYKNTIRLASIRSLRRRLDDVLLLAFMSMLLVLSITISRTLAEVMIFVAPLAIIFLILLIKRKNLLSLALYVIRPPLASYLIKALKQADKSAASLNATFSITSKKENSQVICLIELSLSLNTRQETWKFKHTDLAFCKIVFWSNICYLLATARKHGIKLFLSQNFT